MENLKGLRMAALNGIGQASGCRAAPARTTVAQPSSVLGKAHLLLGAFDDSATALGLTELSRRSGVPKASAHRLAGELVQLGLLARTANAYQLGWRIYELGQMVPGPASLRSVAGPMLVDLHSAVRAVVQLAVPRGSECLYLERFVGRRETSVAAAVGARVPNHRTACGRVFLAHADPYGLTGDEPDVRRAFGAKNVAELVDQFSAIRERRFAEEFGRCLPGFKGIAVPVTYGGSSSVIAAISATLSVDRNDDKQVVHALWATANDISRALQRRASAMRPVDGAELLGRHARAAGRRESTVLRPV